MKHAFRFTLFLFTTFTLLTLVGCSKGTRSETGADRQSSSPTPAAISSSDQVVKVTAAPVSISPGSAADAVVMLSISPGFHINANPATFPYLIPTELESIPYPDNPIYTEKPIYPSPVKKKFVFADQPLSVYEHNVIIRLPVHLASGEKSYVRVTSGAFVPFVALR